MHCRKGFLAFELVNAPLYNVPIYSLSYFCTLLRNSRLLSAVLQMSSLCTGVSDASTFDSMTSRLCVCGGACCRRGRVGGDGERAEEEAGRPHPPGRALHRRAAAERGVPRRGRRQCDSSTLPRSPPPPAGRQRARLPAGRRVYSYHALNICPASFCLRLMRSCKLL